MTQVLSAGVFVENTDGSMSRVGSAFANHRKGFNFTLDQVVISATLKVFPKKSERGRLEECSAEQTIFVVEEYLDAQGVKRNRWVPIGRGWVNAAGFNFVLSAVPFPDSRLVSLPTQARAVA